MDSGTDWLCEILQNVQLEQFYLPIRDQLQVNKYLFTYNILFISLSCQRTIIILN